jgi:Ca2+-binding EF-hand superfamily protein
VPTGVAEVFEQSLHTRKEIAIMVSGISSSSTASLSEMRQKMLSQIDTNGDGSIDKSEMTTFVQQNTSSIFDELFNNLDTDKDNLISQIESNSGLAKLGQEMKNRGAGMPGVSGPPPPEKVFDTADTNEDGMVSKDELSAVMGSNGDDISKLFNEVDTDGDGLISRTEDEAFRAKIPEQMQQSVSSNSSTDSVTDLSQDWQSGLFNALLNSLFASASSTNNSTSLYA